MLVENFLRALLKPVNPLYKVHTERFMLALENRLAPFTYEYQASNGKKLVIKCSYKEKISHNGIKWYQPELYVTAGDYYDDIHIQQDKDGGFYIPFFIINDRNNKPDIMTDYFPGYHARTIRQAVSYLIGGLK